MSKIGLILSVIHYTICGAVCFQFTYLPFDDWDNIYFLSYHHHQIGSMDYYSLFRVRSSYNGIRCISLYILMTYSDADVSCYEAPVMRTRPLVCIGTTNYLIAFHFVLFCFFAFASLLESLFQCRKCTLDGSIRSPYAQTMPWALVELRKVLSLNHLYGWEY